MVSDFGTESCFGIGFDFDPSGVAETVISERGPEVERAEYSPRGAGRVVCFPGQRLGRYRLIERLGRGCQGDVWRAIATEPGVGPVEVALKLLHPSMARDPRRLAQFRREAERRARLGVPSVLPTFEFGEADGYQFMAMPLVDGCSLGEVVSWRRSGGVAAAVEPPHPLADATQAGYLEGVVRVLIQVARTLDHVHASSVAHRDIKPANILLDRNHADRVFLCDFGLARDLDVATPEQLRDGAGTPLYMPPERLLRLKADEVRSDVYALGATLYEAVTLVPPVQVPDDLPWSAWNSYLASTRPTPLRSIRPEIPVLLEAIIHRALAHEPLERHPGAAELADDLEQFLVGHPGAGGSALRGSAPTWPAAATTTARGMPAWNEPEFGRALPLAHDSSWMALERTRMTSSWLALCPSCLCDPDRDAWEALNAVE
jgi:serine/threonine-protein kinase